MCRGRLAPSALVTDDADGLSLHVDALLDASRGACKPPAAALAPAPARRAPYAGLGLGQSDTRLRGACEPPAAALAPAPARRAPYAGVGFGQPGTGSRQQRALAEPGPAHCVATHDAAGGGAGSWEPGSALDGYVGQDWEASLAWDDEPPVLAPAPQPQAGPARLPGLRAEPRPVQPSPGRAVEEARPIASPALPLPALEHLPPPLRHSAPVPARKLGTLRPSNAATGPNPNPSPLASPVSSPGRGAPLRRGSSVSQVLSGGRASQDEGAQSLSSSMDLDDMEDARPSAHRSAGEAQLALPALPTLENHFVTGERGCAGLGECAAAAPHFNFGASSAPAAGQHTPAHLMAGLQDILNCVRTGEPANLGLGCGGGHSSGCLPQANPAAGSVPWAGSGACTGPAVHALLNPAAQLPAQPAAWYGNPVQLAAGIGPAPLPWGSL